MTDSVQVFPPGFRVTDANDDPVNNAKIKFREIGPGATRTVYSDEALTVSLGHTVRTRSDGFPVVSEGSSTTVMIYTGDTPYYVEITDSSDVAIFPAKDNVKGAIDTSTFLTTGSTSTLDIPVLAKAISYTVLSADNGKLIAADATGGFITMTLPSAITVGDGWNVEISNVGTANQVGISATQAIGTPMGNLTAFALRPGESCWIKSNGSTFEATAFAPAFLTGLTGVIKIADRLSTPPASPTAGARYIVGSAPTGAWSTFAEHDIAEATGQSTWFKVTPASDCGWVAFVEDEDQYVAFKGAAWKKMGGSALQVFTGSGTYTPTAGMVNCLVLSTGGGGGSGGVDSDGSASSASGGGGAGATAIEMFSASDIGASQTVTIGAAGTAGANTGTNGGSGGDTTFGALHTAGGGAGGTGLSATTGTSVSVGGNGGTATGGGVNISGGDGELGDVVTADQANGGSGGASFWGGGGRGSAVVATGVSAGRAGLAYGAGGGGSGNINTAAGETGAAGAGGIVVVVEFF